ncbi:ATP-binding protein [Streptomyces sp. JW3]|uniref:sensor histidine kinase n=1 Tax=Streptomyces sp. JW3 TaxID=3456955 RepID=UPI003FA42206
MTSPTPSGERPAISSLLPVFLITAVAAGLVVAAAVAAAPEAVRVPLALGAGAAGLLLSVAVTVAVHGVRSARTARRRLESANQELGRLLQERVRIAEEARQERTRLTAELDRERARLTAELAQEHARAAAELVQERARLTDAHATEHARLTAEYEAELARLTEEHAAERDRLAEQHMAERARLTGEVARVTKRFREAESRRAAAVSATANVAGRLQALATATLADLRTMEERHADEDVLTDLLHLDHRTAQAGRLADSVAVLAGARSGRRWARPIGMESILRGAMGRISGYQRVRVHSTSETAVAGHAAEGVMHALAEILDNAANFSPPTAEVHVYVEEVPAGAIVSVEDSGLVMGDVQLRRAERAVSGRTAGLGGLTGTRLGLAVVGRLAQRYGLKVSFRPSARGGTGVLMLIPQDLLVSASGTRRTPGTIDAADTADPAVVTDAADTADPAVVTDAADTADPAVVTDAADTADPAVVADAADTADPAVVADAAPGAPRLPHRHGSTAAALPGPDTDAVPRHTAPTAADQDATTGQEAADHPDAQGGPALPHGLPRRRRGRTLAEAERAQLAQRPATPSAPPTREESLARVARFSSFRQAVRGAHTPAADDTPETADAPRTAATADATPQPTDGRPDDRPDGRDDGRDGPATTTGTPSSPTPSHP